MFEWGNQTCLRWTRVDMLDRDIQTWDDLGEHYMSETPKHEWDELCMRN